METVELERQKQELLKKRAKRKSLQKRKAIIMRRRVMLAIGFTAGVVGLFSLFNSFNKMTDNEKNKDEIGVDVLFGSVAGANIGIEAYNKYLEELNVFDETKVREYIMEEYNLTEEELDVVIAVAMSEAKEGDYLDTYCVINCIYNRTLNNRWSNYIDTLEGENAGKSLYHQVVAKYQFEVISNGRYLKFLNSELNDSKRAVYDFLLTNICYHDYCSFRASWCDREGRIQFVEDGNLYFDQSEDYIETNPNGIIKYATLANAKNYDKPKSK